MKSAAGHLIILSIAVVAVGSFSISELYAQQWPAQRPPVENSLPQYRSPNSNDSQRLPLDFFDPSSGGAKVPPRLPTTNDFYRGKSDSSLPVAPSAEPAKMLPAPAARPLGLQGKPGSNPEAAFPKSSNQNAAAKAKSKGRSKPLPVVDDSIFRDTSPYPIDHRKPCWQCGQGNHCSSCLSLGNEGRPYRDKVYGGCECDSRKPTAHPNFSVHWPRPFSAWLDERHPERAAKRYDACPDKYIVDVFNPLSKLKLSKYKRTDNGYCGNDSDPYGCLGESKLREAKYARPIAVQQLR